MLKYNPIIKNGKFRVTDGSHTYTCRAGDKAEAGYKFTEKFGITRNAENMKALNYEVIEPTKRQFDE